MSTQTRTPNHSPQRHAKWSAAISAAFAAYQADHPIVQAWSAKVEEAARFESTDLAWKQARGTKQAAMRARTNATATLKFEVQRWSSLLAQDRQDLDASVFAQLRPDPTRIAQAARDLLAFAEGQDELDYVSELNAAIAPALAACDAAIVAFAAAATAEREAISERRAVMLHIEGMLTPFRNMLEGILGKGDPAVRKLKLPYRRVTGASADAGEGAGESSVGLVVGGAETDTTDEAEGEVAAA